MFSRLAHSVRRHRGGTRLLDGASKWALIQEWIAVKPTVQIAGVIHAFFDNEFGASAFMESDEAQLAPLVVLLKKDDNLVIKKLIFEVLTVRHTRV